MFKWKIYDQKQFLVLQGVLNTIYIFKKKIKITKTESRGVWEIYENICHSGIFVN